MESLNQTCDHLLGVSRFCFARPACLAWTLLTFACDGGDGGIVAMSTSFDPKMLDFDVVAVGQTARKTATIRNASSESLTIRDARFDPAAGVFSARIGDASTTLRGAPIPKSGQIEVAIVFEPNADADFSTKLVVAFDKAEVSLPIHAVGRRLGPPVPTVSPSTISFLATEVGRDVTQMVHLTNQGESDGVLREIRPKTTTGEDPFSVTDLAGGSPVPSNLIPAHGAGAVDLLVHFVPRASGSFQQTIELIFDGGQSASISVSGTAVPAGQLQCDTTAIAFGQVPRGSSATKSVHCSVSGGKYTLGRIGLTPSSSTMFEIPNPPSGLTGADTLDFDVAFHARGLAETVAGTVEIVSAAGSVLHIGLSGEVTPPPPGMTDLSVTLTWNTPGTDFDIHLVRSGASPFDSRSDCYYADKNPDWGVPDDPSDDPFLDRDATDGYGPEQINLSSAFEQQYDLYVHWYNFIAVTPPMTAVMVQFTIHGGAPTMFSQSMSTCGSTWHAGTFHMTSTSGTFQPSSDPLTDAWKSRAAQRCQ
jgi:hypothetical protein